MITVDPTIQSTQPNTPIRCSFSFRVKWARTALLRRDHTQEHVHVFLKKKEEENTQNLAVSTLQMVYNSHLAITNSQSYLTIMLSAPSGVTRTAGANM